ncbi:MULTISPECIES: phage tail protein [Glaesserella]|uniref:Phage tail protein n=1 Tax=Glaesserella australis TaxID=2094024 RepID=A0A328BWA1_9PAST|nr:MULTISPECIES: phage tail protein [Glaesserella]AUI66701.1 phage tail protein [Glaesserella sp. 15-184]RAL17905.1 phage tail protein [Glaesserella australis]
MAQVYEGSCVLEVDGVEIDITKIDTKTVTGRKVVKTMNSQGRAKGYMQGIAEYTISVTAVEPEDGTFVDWDNIKNAKLTLYPLNKSDKRTSYLGCFSTEVGSSYTVDNESVRDIQLGALRKVYE